ncbi:MAG: glycosyltransferase family 39 protein [Rufibacter sp.]
MSLLSRKLLLEKTFPKSLTSIILLLIILAGTILRLKDLTYKGLWLDELHTVIETNPEISLSDILYFMQNTDQHPPLYFFTAHYWLKLIGYHDFAIKLLSVIAGVASILSMFHLGKEARNKTVGLIAAALVAFNYFHIFYSQEARNYIFAFLFACLSFTYLLKALKKPSITAGIAYALATILLLYSHYYSLFVVVAQAVIVLFLYIIRKENQKYIKCFGVAALVTIILYAPWIPTLLKIGSISSFWLEKPSASFFIDYYKEYFGYYSLIIYINTALLAVFIVSVIVAWKGKKVTRFTPIQENLPLLGFILLSWVVISYGIPYLRSITATPMLFPRYTIVTLPAIFLAIAIGIDLLRFTWLKTIFVFGICFLTTVNLVYSQDYYRSRPKQEWREMTLFVAKHNVAQYPVVSDRSWYLSYYFKIFDVSYPIVEINADFLKSTDTKGFWIMTGHGGNPIPKELEAFIEENYIVKEDFVGFDTWAKLFLRSSGNSSLKTLTITGGDNFGEGYKALWTNSNLSTEPIELEEGEYELVINAYGTKAGDIFPMATVSKAGVKLGSKEISDSKNYFIPFTQADKNPVKFFVDFVNDSLDEANSEDRNLFIKSIKIRPLQ